MRTVWWTCMVGLSACVTSAPDTGQDTDEANDDTDAPVLDTLARWLDTDAATVGADTYQVGDAPIGATALDGTWSGTFELTEVNPLGTNPRCNGTVSLTIDGNAFRHVEARFLCSTWDPNNPARPPIGRPYGELTGIGFATLDPGDLSSFRLDVGFGARNRQLLDLDSGLVVVSEATMSLDYDDVVGIGALRSGNRVTMEVTREVP